MTSSGGHKDIESTIGQKITMMGSDTRMIASAIANLYWVVSNLILVIVVCCLLVHEIGIAGIVGTFFLSSYVLPIKGWIGKLIQKATKKYIQNSDGELNLLES